MQDLFTRFHSLNRPRLLARAARAGMASYSRSRDLRRVIGAHPPRTRGAILMRLLDLEAELDVLRRTEATGYSVVRHVDILIALAAEGQAIFANAEGTQTNAAPHKGAVLT